MILLGRHHLVAQPSIIDPLKQRGAAAPLLTFALSYCAVAASSGNSPPLGRGGCQIT